MTIGVGFRCQDGIVIASDSLITYEGSHKRYEEKIYEFYGSNHSWSAIFTHASLPDTMRRFGGEFDAYSRNVPINSVADLTDVIETVMLQRMLPLVAGFDSAHLSMIGALCANGTLHMVKTCGEKVLPARDYEYVGVGDSSLLRFLSHLLCESTRYGFESEQAALLATYLVYQAKQWVTDCGGRTHLRILWPNGHRDVRDGETRDSEAEIEKLEERLAIAASLSFSRKVSALILAQNWDLVVEMLKNGHPV